MHPAVIELIDLLQLEQVEPFAFLGQNETRHLGPRLFGGQVLAQALKAAAMTVEGRVAHSMHAQFLRPGTRKQPVLFRTETVRDGRSFSMRRVSAMQKKACIFKAMLSFHRAEEGLHYQVESQQHPLPENLQDDVLIAHQLDEKIKKSIPWALKQRAFEIRSVYPLNRKPPEHPVKPSWLKLRSKLGDDPLLHQCLIVYATDMGLLSTSLVPHLRQYRRSRLVGASLDHAIWFHQPMRADEWWMYERDSPFSGGARGFNRALIFDVDGQLAMSVAQDSLIRVLHREGVS